MKQRDYRKEAEVLVDRCALLEEEYTRAFRKLRDTKDLRALNTCEMIARELEKIDPNFKLQTDATLHESMKGMMQSADHGPEKHPRRERFILTAMRLLKKGIYKPLS